MASSLASQLGGPQCGDDIRPSVSPMPRPGSSAPRAGSPRPSLPALAGLSPPQSGPRVPGPRGTGRGGAREGRAIGRRGRCRFLRGPSPRPSASSAQRPRLWAAAAREGFRVSGISLSGLAGVTHAPRFLLVRLRVPGAQLCSHGWDRDPTAEARGARAAVHPQHRKTPYSLRRWTSECP